MVTGVGKTRFHERSYPVAIRMFAEGHGYKKVAKVVWDMFPEHRKGGELQLLWTAFQNIQKTRSDEILALRQKLNDSINDDHWIANKRNRVRALQEMFEDLNRWVPDKVLHVRGQKKADGEDAGKLLDSAEAPGECERLPGSAVVVYKKDVRGMMEVLKQVREELGEDATGKAAQSLADLVKMAETDRGLDPTVIDVEAVGGDTAPMTEDALLIDSPSPYPSAGADDEMGFLDGNDHKPKQDISEIAERVKSRLNS